MSDIFASPVPVAQKKQVMQTNALLEEEQAFKKKQLSPQANQPKIDEKIAEACFEQDELVANIQNEEGGEAKVVKIQSAFRGQQARKSVKEEKAATKIQASYRGKSERKMLEKQSESATKIQAQFRGK